MDTHKVMVVIFSCMIFFGLGSCQSKKGDHLRSDIVIDANNQGYFVNVYGDTIRKLNRTEEEWKKTLNELEYHVLREKGTERAFTGDLLDIKVEGLYSCRGCSLPLFASKHKFDSGTGWPSFYDVLDQAAIKLDTDYDLAYPRTELTCARCGGHLGHVFDDGPKPTGKRYCINSVSLDFVKTEN